MVFFNEIYGPSSVFFPPQLWVAFCLASLGRRHSLRSFSPLPKHKKQTVVASRSFLWLKKKVSFSLLPSHYYAQGKFSGENCPLEQFMCNFPSETPTVLFLVLRSFLKSSMLQSLLLLTAICSPALSCFHDVVETERGQPPCCYLVKYAATVGHKIEFGSKTFVLHPNELYFTTRPKNMGKKPARIFLVFEFFSVIWSIVCRYWVKYAGVRMWVSSWWSLLPQTSFIP